MLNVFGVLADATVTVYVSAALSPSAVRASVFASASRALSLQADEAPDHGPGDEQERGEPNHAGGSLDAGPGGPDSEPRGAGHVARPSGLSPA
jgi:hypothetical protein